MSPAVLLILAQSLGNTAPFPSSTPIPTAPYTMQQLDRDRDGSVSAAEASAAPQLSAQFGTLDVNGNGALEPAEFARFDASGARGGYSGSTTTTPSSTTTQTYPGATPPPLQPAPGSTNPSGPAPSQPPR